MSIEVTQDGALKKLLLHYTIIIYYGSVYLIPF